ncbi:MAG: methionyl-tRNA formyltransferase [Actinobacteria bacterium]|nr:methionyl-tRNA formyltransferase [Actinomycetota bacterium]
MTLRLPGAPRRIAYLGTPDLAVPTLEALVGAGYEVVLVVTAPDARRVRRGDPEPSPVKAAAQRLGLAVSHDLADVGDAGADLGVVVAYGRIIPTALLDVVPMINLHFSLLPRWRGAAPVERALLAGDERTGVCIMDVAEALDEGDVYARAEVVIGSDATLESLRSELVDLGTGLLLTGLRDGFGPPVPQSGDVSYAAKITQDDKRLDFATGAEMIRRVVSLGGAWTTFRSKRLKVWAVASRSDGEPVADPGTLLGPVQGIGPRVAAGGEWVELLQVQPEGKPRMAAVDWARGARLGPAERLGV